MSIDQNNIITDVVNKIESIEKKHFATETVELEAWYDIRFSVFNKITRELGIYDVAHVTKKKNLNKLQRIYNKINSIVYLFFRNPFFYYLNRKPYLFYGHSRRKLESDGNYWDIYTDPITKVLYNNYLTIEKTYGGRHYKPVPTKNLAYTDGFFLLKRIIEIKKITVPDNVKEKLSHIEIDINKEFGTSIEIERIGVDRYISNVINERLHNCLFKLLKPKIIFLVCSYGKEPIIRAAKKLHIPTVELQHGTIDKNHVGYNFLEDLPKRSFPKYFFSFGDYWSSTTHLPIATKKILSIGFPYLEDRTKNFSSKRKKRQIIFISQGITGKKLSVFASDFAKNNGESQIYYKLHPGEVLRWKKDYTELVEANNKGLLTVVEGQTPSLYELFSDSMVQIGVNSTALFEGIKFGCKTYLVNLPGVEYMDGIIKEGIATLIDNPAEIEISPLDESKKQIVNKIFATDWQTNFTKAIENISKREYNNSSLVEYIRACKY